MRMIKKMIGLFFLLLFSYNNCYCQNTIPEFNFPEYRNSCSNYMLTNFDNLVNTLKFSKKDCVYYLNFIQFNFTEQGEIVNIKNVPDNPWFEIDSTIKRKIDEQIFNIINLTSKHWIVKQEDLNKDYLLVVSLDFLGKSCSSNSRLSSLYMSFVSKKPSTSWSVIGLFQSRYILR